MGKHKAAKMTKAERQNYEDFHGSGETKFLIRRPSDLIMLPILIPMALPLIAYTIAMSFFTVLAFITAPFRRN